MGSVQHHTNKVTHPMRARRHARGITTPGYNYCCSSYPFHQQRERKKYNTSREGEDEEKERKELAEKERKDTEGEKEREAKPEKRKYE